MLRYIIGGVALVATRYGLKKYLDKFEMRTSPSSKTQNNIKMDNLDTNEIGIANLVCLEGDDFLEARVVEKSHKFNEMMYRLFCIIGKFARKTIKRRKFAGSKICLLVYQRRKDLEI